MRSTAVRATRQRLVLVALAAVGALLAAGCGSSTSGTSADSQLTKDATLLRSNVARAPASASPTALASGIRALGYQLLERLDAGSTAGNTVVSPASLAIAFAMLREGATGDAATQIDDVLHLPANRSAAFNVLLHALGDAGAGNVLALGDAAFVQHGYPILASYLDTLQRWYSAGVYQTNFSQPGTAAINAYVAEQTHGLIPKLLAHPVDAQTVLELVNTIYLNARWAHRFPNGGRGDFTDASGARVRTGFMEQTSAMRWTGGGAWQAVAIPYRGGALSMWVLTPTGNTSPLRLLSPQILQEAQSGLQPYQVDLTMPTWSFATSPEQQNLEPVLKAMGLQAPFQPGHLMGIAQDPTLAVGQVLQQARIQVGAEGTVAAAVTAIGAEAVSGSSDLQSVDLDHPFAYVVMDNATGVPLFEGTVSNPSLHS